MQSRSPRVMVLVMIITAAIAGCRDTVNDPADPGGEDTTKTVFIPKAGSSYTTFSYDINSSGQKDPGTDRTITTSVLATNGSAHGRQNVVVFSIPSGGESPMLIYEPDGDIATVSHFTNGSSAFEFVAPPVWISLPFGSKAGTTVRTYDTTATSAGENGGYTLRQSTAYLGTEELQIGAEKIKTEKVLLTSNWTATHGGGAPSETVETKETLWYAPSIGFFVKIRGERHSNRDPAFAGWHTELTGYSLK